jgi:PAS domain S-box-containing protein
MKSPISKIIFILTCLLHFSAASQLFTFRNINHKNGLKLSSITAISQDKNGFIWFGTDGAGLQKYDGKTVKTLSIKNQEHHISSIQCINDQVLFSSLYLGFYKLQNDKITSIISLNYAKQFGEKILIRKIKDKFLLVGTKKIVLYDNKETFSVPFQKENKIIQVIELKGAIILVGSKQSFFINDKKVENLNIWLGISSSETYEVGSIRKTTLQLYDFKNSIQKTVYLNKDNSIFHSTENPFQHTIKKHVKSAFSKYQKIILLDSDNNLYQLKDGFKFIPKNTSKEDVLFSKLFIDNNLDYWASSENSGVFKVSNEPFTKIDLDPVYQNKLISFIFKSTENNVIISDYLDFTYQNNFEGGSFDKINLRLFSQTKIGELDVFASSKGVYVLEKGKLTLSTFKIPKEKIIFVFALENMLYYCIENKGLFKYNIDNQTNEKIIADTALSHVYTAQTNKFRNLIYFGTNNGIYEYTLKDKKLENLNSSIPYQGSYSGISTIDIYGNLWFTLDKALIGISKDENIFIITDKKHFKSTLFYTLNSDNFGNLLIGTNEGFSKIKINEMGRVLGSVHYNTSNGFEGFETHMRSNFKDYDGNIIYIGTIEGLFAVNTVVLENIPKPPKPFVFQNFKFETYSHELDEDLVKISFLAINPKLKGIQYSYRLKGKSSEWSDLTSDNDAFFANLSDQEYIFQVKSTFDGITFSQITSFKIVKSTPFWKSKWFILLLILSIALANIIVLDRSKSFQLSQIIENQNIEINGKTTNLILAFGFIAVSSTSFVAPFLDSNLLDLRYLNITISLILLVLLILGFTKKKLQHIRKFLLHFALISISIFCYISTYLTEIHPFYLVVLILCSSLTPFVLNKIREVIVFSVFNLIAAVSIVYLSENAKYDEILFLIAIISSICLSIFATYIRNESLQKLIFISGIVNKGNLFALAFNEENKITYISENCYKMLLIGNDDFLGKDLKKLNQLINYELAKLGEDFLEFFKNDLKLTFPMKGSNNAIIWVEWSCKTFSNSIKVLFGQDVTEKIKLERNYESLIENANDLIFTVNYNGEIEFVNTKFKEVLAYEEKELYGRSSLFLVDKAYETKVKDIYEQQFKNKIVSTYHEFPIIKKDGTKVWIGQNSTLIFAPGSSKIIKGFLCLARDITDKRRSRKIIEEQNKDITSSINYARKIQLNLLPQKEIFNRYFKDTAIFFKPKDIVSGDFYWIDHFDDKTFVVLGDCTGHGVPGAFMTLLGINLLNQIISENKITECGQILTKLDEGLRQVLPKEHDSSVKDGIELVVLLIDNNSNTIDYACAGGKFISIENNKTVIRRGESKHIGDKAFSNFSQYNTYSFEKNSVSNIYLFSDGIQDQFGGPNDKKFSVKKLIETLQLNNKESVSFNVNALQEKINTWKSTYKQTDDICIIGLQIN